MEQVIEHFQAAKEYREQANECSNFQASKKLKLADLALDELEVTIEKLIAEVSEQNYRLGVLESENR